MSDLDVKLPVGRMIFGYVIIVALLAVVTVATHFVPAGTYAREARIDEETGTKMEVIVKDSFSFVTQNPQGMADFFISPVKSLYYKGIVGAVIVAFVILIGGSFTAMRRTGALDAGIVRFIERLKGREHLVIPATMIFFSLFGALFGILEELVPFIILVVPMAIAMGYDSLVGLMMIFGACAIGFTAAMTNPFTVLIAQTIAELPPYSGIVFRFFVWAFMIGIAILYTSWYAKKVKMNPKASIVSEFDDEQRKKIGELGKKHVDFTPAHRRVIWIIGISVILLFLFIIGGEILFPKLMGNVSFPIIILIFIIMGILSGIFGGLGVWGTIKAFGKGIVTFIPAGIFVMIARAVFVIADEGLIIDTMLFYLSGFVGQFNAVVASWIMFLVQTAINFFIPSGSALAMISMPVMVPLGELVGVTRQVSVLAYQMGDGFSNIFWPTNPMLIIAISLAGVSWTKWARFMLPLQLILLLAGFLVLAIAVFIGWGPF